MLVAICAAVLAPQATLHVDIQSPCAQGNGTPSTPYCRVGHAIAAASDGDTILIAPGAYDEELVIDKDLTLMGTGGPGRPLLSGLGAWTVVTTSPGTRVRIEGVSIAYGRSTSATSAAGGIRSQGELTLVDTTIRDCAIGPDFPDEGGAGILHDSPDRLIARGCTFRGLRYIGDPFSGFLDTMGPIHLAGEGAALFEECTFTGNEIPYCCAINAEGGPLVIRRCAIFGNDATQTIARAGAVMSNAPALLVEDSTIHDNVGTGVFIQAGTGPFLVNSCTVTDNTSSGIFAGGIEAFQFTVEIGNSVVVDNGNLQLVGQFLSGGTNFLGGTVGGLFEFTPGPTDVIRTSGVPFPASGLLDLADNGGPTMTRLPGCDSPLVDSGASSTPGATDQRGFPRPPGRVDRGAAEADCTPVPGCVAELNSAGRTGRLEALGPVLVSANDVELRAFDLPPEVFGIFLVSRTAAFTPQPGGSEGNLCLGGTIGRFVASGEVFQTNVAGFARLDIDLTALPQGGVTASAAPGETWHFQSWHRDVVQGLPTSNYAEAIALTVR